MMTAIQPDERHIGPDPATSVSTKPTRNSWSLFGSTDTWTLLAPPVTPLGRFHTHSAAISRLPPAVLAPGVAVDGRRGLRPELATGTARPWPWPWRRSSWGPPAGRPARSPSTPRC